MKTINLHKELIELLEKHNIELSKLFLSEFNHIVDNKELEGLEITRKYDMLYNSSVLGYQSLDYNGNILDTNTTWLKILGYQKSEVIGKWFGNFLHKDYVDTFKKRFEKFTKEGIAENVQYKLRKKNGDFAHVLFKGCVLYNPDGQFKCTYCSFMDITEQEEMLIKLKESEEKYRKLTENSPEITYINNLNKGALFWSAKVKDILGFDPDNILEDTSLWTKSLHKDDIPAINRILNNVKVGKTYDLEYRIYDINNNLHWFHDRIFNVYKKNGDLIIEGIISDITSQKESAIQLKENEEKFRTITNSAQDAIILIDNKGDVVFWNKAATEIFQYNEEEMIGKNLHSIIVPSKYMASHLKAFKNFIKDGKGSVINQIVELTACRKDKVEIPVELSLSSLKLNGKWHSVGILRDISERVKGQKALIESEKRFKKLSSLTFEGIVIHKNGVSIDCNQSFLNLLQYDKKEVINKNVLDYIDPDYHDLVKENVSKNIAKPYEVEAVRKDGFRIPVEIEARDVKINNEIIRVAAVRNITERKKNQQKLIESEERFKKLSSLTFEGIVIHNDSFIIDCNESFLKILNYSRDEIINKNLLEFIHKDYREIVEKNIAKKTSSPYEIIALKKDGIEIPIETEAQNVKINDRIVRVVAIRDITEKVKAKEKIIESEEKYWNLFQFLEDGLLRADLNGLITLANLSVARMFGYSKPEDMIGTPMANLYENSVDRKKMLTALKKEGILKNYEIKLKTKHGKTFWTSSNIKFLNSKDGEIIGTEGIIRDISDKKEALNALEESKTKYNSLFSSMNEGVVLHEVVYNKNNVAIDYKIIEANKAFENQTGIKFKSSFNKLASKFYQTTPAPYLDVYAKVAETGEPIDFESYFPPLKKHFNISVFSPKKGWFATVFNDITERKKSEKKLRELLEKSEKSQAEITELLNATHSILKSDDFDTIAREIFDACKRAIGAKAGYVAMLSNDGTENELLFLDDGGLPCDVNPELPMPIRGLRAEAYKTGEAVYDNNFMNSKWAKFMPNNHLVLNNVLFAPLIIDKKAIGLIGISNKEVGFTDEDAKLAKAFADYASIALQNSRNIEELKTNYEKLNELNATKDKFFSIIAHDLRGPANHLVGFADLLERNYQKYSKEKLSHIINLMSSSAKSTYKLLDNLLIWSRSQRNTISYNPEIFLCKDLVSEVIEELEHLAFAKDIKIVTDKNPGHLVSVDKEMFKTVYRNLISNAIKFTKEGGKIDIGCGKVSDKFVEFYIKDNGIGIPEENMDKLFKIDENITTEGTNNEKGTGLGLILCKDFIEKHGGKIWAESELNKGTTFWFTFPRSTENK